MGEARADIGTKFSRWHSPDSYALFTLKDAWRKASALFSIRNNATCSGTCNVLTV